MSLGSSLGRSAYRDDRRRRLLAEESAAHAPLTDASYTTHTDDVPGPPPRSQNYGDAGFLARQPQPSDLIPHRVSTLAVMFVLGLAAIGGLLELGTRNAVSLQIPKFPTPAEGDSPIFATPLRGVPAKIGTVPQSPVFDPSAAGSLGRWFSSLILLAAGVASLLVYNIRRHKVDDYQGRYRIWLWAAGCCLLMATDTAAPLHDWLGRRLSALAGTPLVGDGSIWWVVPAALLLGSVGSRLLVDVWECRISSGLLALATGCYLAAIAVHCGWLGPDPKDTPVAQLLCDHGCRMVGHLLLLIAMTWHARHVLLDAQGKLPRHPAESQHAGDPDAEEQPEPDGDSAAGDAAASADRWVAVDRPHGTGQPVLRRVGPSGLPRPAPVATGAAAAVPNQLATAAAAPRPVATAATPAQATAAPAVAKSPPAAASSPALPSSDHKLGKMERKALRKRLLEERLQRQRRAAPNWGG
jgi:hypothetical protein